MLSSFMKECHENASRSIFKDFETEMILNKTGTFIHLMSCVNSCEIYSWEFHKTRYLIIYLFMYLFIVA